MFTLFISDGKDLEPGRGVPGPYQIVIRKINLAKDNKYLMEIELQ